MNYGWSLHGVQVVGGSNPLAPTKYSFSLSSLRDTATYVRHGGGENSRVLGEFAFAPVLASEIVRGNAAATRDADRGGGSPEVSNGVQPSSD